MPIYEYVCGACGKAHEALQKISDAPLTDCSACGQSALKKKVSAPAFRLAGSGWYETDFKTGKKKNLVSNDKESANKSSQNLSSDSKKATKQDKISK